jgi:uncharacterized protein (DUF1501 family)
MRAMAASSAGRGQWHDMFANTMRTQLEVARDVAPAFVDRLPDNGLVRRLTLAARLINANIGMRVLDVSLDGFDDHEGQLPSHAALMAELDAGLRAFYDTLLPQWRDRVTLMTMSEFGRTSYSNGSSGTDHGTASDLFVIGRARPVGPDGTPCRLPQRHRHRGRFVDGRWWQHDRERLVREPRAVHQWPRWWGDP